MTAIACIARKAIALIITHQILTNSVHTRIASAFVDIYFTVSSRKPVFTIARIVFCTKSAVAVIETRLRLAIIYTSFTIISFPAFRTYTLIIIDLVDTDVANRTNDLKTFVNICFTIQT
jgi:hypothetical protein